MLNFVYRLFPPPKFLDFPAIGLDVSDRSIKYVQLRQIGRGIRIDKIGKRDLNEGIVEAGEIKKPDELSASIASVIKPLGVIHVVTALPEERAYISVMSLPAANKSQLYEAVETGLPEKIPLPAGEAIFDFELMPPAQISEGGAKISENQPTHQDAVVYALPQAVVKKYLDVYTGAGVYPICFVMETAALSRALLSENNGKEVTMMIDFGKTRTTFVIVAGGLVRFSSTVSVAGESLDRAIAKSAGVSLKDAERLKKNTGLSKSDGNGTVFDALLPVVSALADEAERYILFWNTHAEHVHGSSPEIKKVILSGGDSNLIGFKEYLETKLGIAVKHGNSWVNVAPFEEYVPDVSFNESLTFSTAIGLALIALKGN